MEPEVDLIEDPYPPPVSQLLSLGKPPYAAQLDYTQLGISRHEAPTLIRMATDGQLLDGPPERPLVWSPVHAWRALAELRAEAAIAPLIELFRRVDNDIDEWVSGDLPKSLARFGATALGPLTPTSLIPPAGIGGAWRRRGPSAASGRRSLICDWTASPRSPRNWSV